MTPEQALKNAIHDLQSLSARDPKTLTPEEREQLGEAIKTVNRLMPLLAKPVNTRSTPNE